MEGLVVQEANLKYLKLGFLIWCAYLSTVKEQRISNLMKGKVVDGNAKDQNDNEETAQHEMWRWISGKSEHTFPIILNACAQDHLAPLCRKPLDFFIKYVIVWAYILIIFCITRHLTISFHLAFRRAHLIWQAPSIDISLHFSRLV